MDYFRIQPLRFTRFINVPIMCRRHHHDHDNDDTAQFLNSPNPNPNSISTKSKSIERHDTTTYIFRTPSIPRRFVLEKAKALGVPLGPLYSQLKAGKSVTFWNNNDVRNSCFASDNKGRKGGKKKKKKFKRMKGNCCSNNN